MISILKGAGVWDYLAFAGVAFLVIRGFVRGCSGEMGRLVGTVTAAAVGYFGFRPIASLVLASPVFGANPYAGRLVTFILMAVLCIAVGFGLSHLLTHFIRLVIAQPFDGILGGIIGGVKALVVVAALVALGLLNPKEEERARLTEQSLTAQWLAPLLKNITGPDG